MLVSEFISRFRNSFPIEITQGTAFSFDPEPDIEYFPYEIKQRLNLENNEWEDLPEPHIIDEHLDELKPALVKTGMFIRFRPPYEKWLYYPLEIYSAQAVINSAVPNEAIKAVHFYLDIETQFYQTSNSSILEQSKKVQEVSLNLPESPQSGLLDLPYLATDGKRKFKKWEKSFHSFIKLHRTLLGAFAWQGYQAKGRGLIACESSQKNDLGVPTYYLTSDEALGMEWPGDFYPKLLEAIRTYNPEQQIVVLFEDNWVGGDTLGVTPAPPVCFKRLQRRLQKLTSETKQIDTVYLR